MKKALLLALFLSGCTIVQRDTELVQFVNKQAEIIVNHDQVLVEIVKRLQEKGILVKPEAIDIKKEK
jgi:hypothetical protein